MKHGVTETSDLQFRQATPDDAPECLELRGLTRQNAASVEWLASIGVTVDSWAEGIRSGTLPGFVCTLSEKIVGYCFGDSQSGEIVVVAMLPEFEDRGIGRRVLNLTGDHLTALGHRRLFLSCNPDPASRSHGFYRHLGWRSTGSFDPHGDEILELLLPDRA